jgi:hypothetical protein
MTRYLAVLTNRVPTREDDVVDISGALIRSFWPEDPLVSPEQTAFRLLEIEKGQAESIECS